MACRFLQENQLDFCVYRVLLLSHWRTSPIPYSCDAKLNEKGVALIAEVASLQLTKPAWYLKNGLQLRRVETAEYRMTGAISRRE